MLLYSRFACDSNKNKNMTNEELYPKPMTKEEFFQLAKNRNRYRVAKPLTGELSYAKIGDTFYSDTLYELGYNMYALVEQDVLELIPDVFPFEKEIVGKNVNSVYVLCPNCKTWGINMPLEKTCGDCGYSEGKTYYDAETIDNYIRALAKQNGA